MALNEGKEGCVEIPALKPRGGVRTAAEPERRVGRESPAPPLPGAGRRVTQVVWAALSAGMRRLEQVAIDTTRVEANASQQRLGRVERLSHGFWRGRDGRTGASRLLMAATPAECSCRQTQRPRPAVA